MLKYKYLIALFIAGLASWLFGCWSKITHQSYADTMVHISYFMLIVSCILLIIKLLKSNNRFLNK
jgi:hypothetical protein